MRARAIGVSAAASATVLVGVVLFAMRCDRATLGDGPLPFRDVAAVSVITLVLPWAFVTYQVARRDLLLLGWIGLVSVLLGLVTALGRPGNLYGVAFLFDLIAATGALLIGAWISVLIARRRDPIARYRGRFYSDGPNTDALRQSESKSERREAAQKARRVGHSAG